MSVVETGLNVIITIIVIVWVVTVMWQIPQVLNKIIKSDKL